MARFQYKQQSNSEIKAVLAICIFIIIIIVFFYAINEFEASSDSSEKENLENSLTRSITYCYATEGSYPENLKYIEKNYGLTYDKSKFFIDYRVVGSNVLPEVTIIDIPKN